MTGGDSQVPTYTGTPHFTDVPAGNWALNYVEYAYSQNVVQGYGNGLYGPTDPVTRGQMAVFIARTLVAPAGDAAIPTPTGSPTFSDVPSTSAFYKQIEYIAACHAGCDGGQRRRHLRAGCHLHPRPDGRLRAAGLSS